MLSKLAHRLNDKLNKGEIITVNVEDVLFKIDFKKQRITDLNGEDKTGLSWTEEEVNLTNKIKKRGYRPKIDGYIEVTKDMICVDGIHKMLSIDPKKNPKIKVKQLKLTWWQALRYAFIIHILGY